MKLGLARTERFPVRILWLFNGECEEAADWESRYEFTWTATRADCDAHIAKLFERLPRTESNPQDFQCRPEELLPDEKKGGRRRRWEYGGRNGGWKLGHNQRAGVRKWEKSWVWGLWRHDTPVWLMSKMVPKLSASAWTWKTGPCNEPQNKRRKVYHCYILHPGFDTTIVFADRGIGQGAST